MRTGLIESWMSDPTQMGPMYPFVGSEVFMVILCLIFWLGWTIWQYRHEGALYQQQAATLKQAGNLEKVVKEYQAAARPFFGD
jgi:hypothetical protein